MSATARTTAAIWTHRAAWLAFAALIVLSPFRADVDLLRRPVGTLYAVYTDVVIFWSDVAALLTLALWAATLALQPRRIWPGPRFIAYPVAALLPLSWMGAPFAVDPPLAVNTSVHLTLLAALGLYVANEVTRPARLVIPVAVMVAVQAVAGIGEVVAQKSLGLTALGEQVLDPHQSVSVITAADGTRFLRAYALTDHPNILGGVLAVGLLLLAGLAPRRLSAARPLLFAIGAMGLTALLVTFSRSAWLGTLVGLGVLAAMLLAARERVQVRHVAVVCAAAAVVAAPFALPFRTALAARTNPAASATETRSIDERTALARATGQVITAHPLGVGAGGLPEAMRAADPHFAYTVQPSSVVLLNVTADEGIPGGAAYLVLLVAPWIALLRKRHEWMPELAAASAALAALTVIGFLDYYTWTYEAGRIWTWLALGLWAVAYRQATSRSSVGAR